MSSRNDRSSRVAGTLVLALAALVVLAPMLVAQETLPQASLPQQNLRPYWHVFAAYSIVIVMIGGWAVSIARRLRSIEDRLVD